MHHFARETPSFRAERQSAEREAFLAFGRYLRIAVTIRFLDDLALFLTHSPIFQSGEWVKSSAIHGGVVDMRDPSSVPQLSA